MAKVKPVNKKKMTKASLAALIVTVAILFGLVLSLVASSGLFVRIQNGASSENYKINGSMMTYYTNSVYQSWFNQYQAYIYYGLISFDPSKPLDEQYTDNTKKETYYDFFVKEAKTQVTKLLKYCEAARVDKDIDFEALQKEAEQYAKDSIKSVKASANANNIDFITFLRQNFGEYVSEKDLYDSLIIEYIASDYSTTMYERIYDAMTDERKNEYFKENLGSYITADYLSFSLSQTVTPEKVDEKKYEGGKDSQEYKDAVAAAQAAAKLQNDLNKIKDKEFMDKLAAAKSADEFKTLLLEYKYEETFKTVYDKALKDQGFADAEKPSEETWKAFRDSIKDAAIKAAVEGKDDIVTAEPADEDNKTETKWDKATKTLPKLVITSLKSVITGATKSAAYTLDTNIGKFLFAGVKAQYGIEYKEGETQGENAAVNDTFFDRKDEESGGFTDAEKADAIAEGKYTYTVYYVIESAHRDELVLRDVGHILLKVDSKVTANTANTFKTSAEAKVAAEKLLEEIKAKLNGITDIEKLKEEFEKIAEEKTADSGVFYENVHKDDNYVQSFKDWIYEAKTAGELGLVESTYGWHIMFYGGETDQAWKVSAHASAASEDLTEWYEALEYKVTINDKIFETIFN